MGRRNTIESLSKMLQIIKLMARDEGVTVTQASDALGVDRWTAKSMIDSLTLDEHGFSIVDFKSPKDKRQTVYKIKKNQVWTLTLPDLNLSDDEGMLLALLLNESRTVPVLKRASEGLRQKINWLHEPGGYQISSVDGFEKTVGPEETEAVALVLKAIKEGMCVEFAYSRPLEYEAKTYQAMPLYVFMYDGGLYLNAQKLPGGEMRSYAMERVKGLPALISVDKSKLPAKLPYDGRLEDPFGPFYDVEEPFTIEVTFNNWQGWYHHQRQWPNSVRVVKNNDGTWTLTATSRYLYGAKRWVLGQGNTIVAIKPDWFKKEILQALREMEDSLIN